MAGGRRLGSGPKPTPPALAALRGNPSHSAPRKVLRATEFSGPAPDWLEVYAQEFWNDYASVYKGLGLLTLLSAPAFIMLCDSWSEYRLLREDITQHGRTHITGPNGRVARPEVAMLRAAFERWKAMAAEFGIGPASLTRITATASAPETDPVEAYRAQRKSA